MTGYMLCYSQEVWGYDLVVISTCLVQCINTVASYCEICLYNVIQLYICTYIVVSYFGVNFISVHIL